MSFQFWTEDYLHLICDAVGLSRSETVSGPEFTPVQAVVQTKIARKEACLDTKWGPDDEGGQTHFGP